jgi:hypothetical protein
MRKLSNSSGEKGKDKEPRPQPITPVEVRLLFNTWSKPLESRNAGTVASLYSIRLVFYQLYQTFHAPTLL